MKTNNAFTLDSIENNFQNDISPSAVQYRKDIDALRGIAILSVFLYHLFPAFIPGGFLGVDVFFVISGFLISKIIFTKLDSNSFNFVDFYKRRINRIFPALLIVLSICFLYGFFVLFQDEFISLGRNVEGASMFLSNRVLYREAGYFDLIAEYKPLLHLWSLAVEEQFYLVWPIILFLSYKITSRGRISLYRRQLIITGIVLITIFSFLISLYLNFWSEGKKLAFYFTGARMWELTIGSLGAYYALYIKKENLSKSLGNLINLICLVIIFSSFFLLDHTHKYLPLLIILPLMSVVFILVFYQNPSLISEKQKILNNRFLVFTGLISYPMYLLHWPLISYYKILIEKDIKWMPAILMFITVALLSYGIYKFIERPLRQINSSKTAIYLCGILIFLGVLGHLACYRTIEPYMNYLFPSAGNAPHGSEDWEFPTRHMKKKVYEGQNFQKIGNSDKIILFLGDSNAEQYAPRIDKILSANKRLKSAVFATKGNLCPLPNVKNVKDDLPFLDATMEYAQSSEVQTVVIAAIWMSYIGGSAKGYSYSNGNLANEFFLQKAINDFQEFIIKLINKGKKVYIITNIPHGEEYDPKNLFKRTFWGKWTFETSKKGDRKKWDNVYQKTKNHLMKISQNTGAILINPESFLCDTDHCLVCTPDGIPVYKDGNHLGATYVRERLTFLDFLFKE